LECASPPRPEVRHDLDAASGATALLDYAPCQVGCSLPRACHALGWLDAAWNAPHHHSLRSGTTWMQLRMRPLRSTMPHAKLEAAGYLNAAMGATASLGLAPCQVGCSLPTGCLALRVGGLDAAWNAPHHHGPRSGTTWMQLLMRPPCSTMPHAKLDAACRRPARPSVPVGWMQLGTCRISTARGQARPGCSFGCDRCARPDPMPSCMQLAAGLPGPRRVGCSLERAESPRPEVRHDLDAAMGATAALGLAPCQVGCSLPGACQPWVGCSLERATPQRPEVRHDLDSASDATASLDYAPCQVACSLLGSAGPSLGWLQLGTRQTTTA
jgi:hypothetical protein